MPAVAQQIPKGWVQEQRGLALYTLGSRLQKQEAKFNPYMVVSISIGYFTLSVMWPFSHLDFLKFYLLAMPSPPSCYRIKLHCV
jgi:hypothetical protein